MRYLMKIALLLQIPNSIYESSKAEGERLVLSAAQKGLDAVVISPTAVIGPYDYNQSYLGQAIIKIYQNSLPMLVPGGYDWVDVRDVVKGALMQLNVVGKERNIYYLAIIVVYVSFLK